MKELGGRGRSRRKFVKAAALLPLAGRTEAKLFGSLWQDAPGEGALGRWQEEQGLPVYTYTGPLRFGRAKYLPDDPYFLLGNHRLTLFAHASGEMQLLSGERAWGRLNQGAVPWSGLNRASVEVDGRRTELIGVESEAAVKAGKRFGVGFSEYSYVLGSGLEVRRTLSVAPSVRTGEGESAVVCTVRLKNGGAKAMHVAYREETGAAYAQIFADWDEHRGVVKYKPRVAQANGTARCDFEVEAMPFRLLTGADGSSAFETMPPSLFVAGLAEKGRFAEVVVSAREEDGRGPWLGASAAMGLKAGEEWSSDFAVGYTRAGAEGVERSVRALRGLVGEERAGPYFRAAWNRRLPEFAGEKDVELRREMRWHAAMLQQMATWKERYDETIVPQGMTYDYEWGRGLSSRDWAQHALPLCTVDAGLARSVVRFLLKRTHADGEVELNELGVGWVESGAMRTSDQQLFLFLLLNEYLRVTNDWSVLEERIGYFPAGRGGKGTGLEHVRSAFLFLRDRIEVGEHGLVRLWNSDWNDMFYFWPTTMPYNSMFGAAESHMNTAMAVVVLGEMAGHLERAPGAGLGGKEKELVGAMRAYRAQLLEAFLRDWGSRAFPRRAYLGRGRAVGEDEMWLEPQGFTLLIPEIGLERKRALSGEVERRLLRREAMGARQIERPATQALTPAGTRENGGFWYALHGMLVLGVGSFDAKQAEELLSRFTLARYAEKFPGYWVGQWTGCDAWDCGLTRTEGMTTMMTWCAHAHAWPLYAYLRLKGDAARSAVRGTGDEARTEASS